MEESTEVLVEKISSHDILPDKMESENTVLLMEEEENGILFEDAGNTQLQEQRDLDFVYVKDVVVVHTKERIG